MHEENSDHQATPIDPEQSSWRSWIVGALFTIVLGFGGTIAHSLNARIVTLEDYGSPALRERISRIEARHEGVQRQQDADSAELRESMRRIELKLDTALERLHTRVLRDQ